MKTKDVCAYLDGIFESVRCDSDYSNNGLQVEASAEVRRLAFAVDATQTTIDKAVEQGADMLVVHHGLSWGDGFRRLTGLDARRYAALFRGNLSLYACHLPLDAHPVLGNNAVLAARLGLDVSEWFCPIRGLSLGAVCRLENPMPYADLLQKVRDNISDTILFQADYTPKGEIHSIGIVSGGGDSALKECTEKAIDCLITGECGHAHVSTALEGNVAVIAAGHYNTENTGIQALMAQCSLDLDVETLQIHAPTGL